MKNWKQMRPFEISFRVMGIIFGCAAIVLCVLEILQIFDVINANFLFLPWGLILLGGENLCNTVYTWRNSRSAAILALCCGVFVIICAIIGIVLL